MFKKPLRTYQRKKTAKSTVIGLEAPILLLDKHNVETDHVKNSSNDSLNDPFETTFDRIAKGAVVPPRPPDEYQDSSWHSSSDSDTNNKSQKFCEPILPIFPVCNNTSKTHLNNNTKKHRSPTKLKRKVASKKTVSKRTRTTPESNIQEKDEQAQKAQGRRKQANRTRRNKQRELKESRDLRNKEILDVYSDVSILVNTTKKPDISYNSGKKYLGQSTLTTDDETSSHNELMGSARSDADSKYISNYAKDIRSCFVKLNAVQHTLHKKKSLKDKRDSYCNTTNSYTSTSETDKNSSTIKKTDAQLIFEVKDDNAIRNFKHNLFESCFVVLDDSVVKSWILKNKKSVNSVIAAEDEENSSETTARNNSMFCPYVTRNRNNLVKTSPVSAKQARETVRKVDAASTKKRQSIISSTPIKRIRLDRLPICSILLSPINSTVFDMPHSHVQTNISPEQDISNIVSSVTFNEKDFRSPNKLQEESDRDVRENKQTQVSLLHTTQTQLIGNSLDGRSERDISNIVSSNRSDKKDFCPSSKLPKEPDTDVHEEQTQILLLSQQARVTRNSFVKLEKMRFEDNEIYVALTQKLDAQNDKASTCSLSALSASIDRSQSLFSDTMTNCKYSTRSATQDNKTNEYLLEKHLLESSNAHTTFENSDITRTKVKCKNETQDNQSMSQSVTDVNTKLSEDFKDTIINGTNVGKHILDETDGERAMLAVLEDPIRVTAKRTQYAKWQLSMSDIFESLINDSAQSSKVLAVETSAIRSEMNCLEAVNNLCEYDDKIGMEKIFLKSGKHWARSLSILTNINNEENLDKMSVGKGKKWRSSVRDVLDMQKQGLLQCCSKADKDVTNLSCNAIDVSSAPSLDANKSIAINPTNHVRLSKRISVRVVLNNTNAKCDTKDASLLEAFGISHREKLSAHGPIVDRKSVIARNVVLQRCSQNCYLPFSECFPDSYLEHCHKIGEGVYGEVFLYEHNGTKSVLKIIPIEGKEAVNGEPQKKFNEILSEIVIAKELANLKSNATYRTDGFVDVKSVNCVIGKYPKKLVELWNTYDDNKRSDNDCPSMFGENQLYITLELSHGGQDLEAFVFQTAEEACAVFLQIAFALAVGEKALEFEHRDLHWGNVLISRTKEPYVYYNLNEKEIKLPSKGMKASIIDFTLSRVSYAGYCMYNDLAVDPALFTAYGDYQFEIYRLMRDKIGNTWRKFEPYTNILWLHYTLDKMITAVRYKKKNIKIHKNAIIKLKAFKDTILQYNSAFDFVNNSVDIEYL